MCKYYTKESKQDREYRLEKWATHGLTGDNNDG